MAESRPSSARDGREALATVLGAHFEVQRLSARGAACVYAGAVPSLILWVHAWHLLSGPVVRCAVLIWAGCAVLGLAFAASAWGRHRRLERSVPEAERVVRVRFAPAPDWPSVSSILIGFSVIASGILWLHALFPGLVSQGVLQLSANGWAFLMAATIGNKWLERLL